MATPVSYLRVPRWRPGYTKEILSRPFYEKKNAVYFFQISLFFSRDIPVFKICQLAKR